MTANKSTKIISVYTEKENFLHTVSSETHKWTDKLLNAAKRGLKKILQWPGSITQLDTNSMSRAASDKVIK
jgi:hypothetical protein